MQNYNADQCSLEIFRTRLRALRKEKELSQLDLARFLQTNNSSVCDWERGRTQPDLIAITKMACLFDVSADYLLGLEDETGTKLKPYPTLESFYLSNLKK